MRYAVAFAAVASSLLSAAPALAAGCDHAYFPLKTGSTWSYQTESGGKSTQKVVKVDGSTVTLEVGVSMDGKSKPMTMNVQGTCSDDGVDVNMDGAAPGMTVKGHTGVSLAPASKLVPGYSWEETLQVSMMGMDMNTKITHKVVGQEKVKVPAGEYDALKVENDTETTMSASGAMAEMFKNAKPQTGTGYSWYAKGVGVVKEDNVTPGKKARHKTLDLLSYTP